MVLKSLRPLSLLFALGAMILIALSAPATSEGYGDPAIVQDGDAAAAEPGEPFTVSFSSNVDCAWSSTFQGQDGGNSTGFDYSATFTAPTDPGTYSGTVVCRYSADGPFRPVAYSEDATYAAGRDLTTTQTFTVVVGGDASGADSASDDTAASDTTGSGALADTGGDSWQVLALGAGLVIVGGGVAIAARRRKSA